MFDTAITVDNQIVNCGLHKLGGVFKKTKPKRLKIIRSRAMKEFVIPAVDEQRAVLDGAERFFPLIAPVEHAAFDDDRVRRNDARLARRAFSDIERISLMAITAQMVKELREKTGRTRYQFLRAELQTCFTALEIGKYELSVGNATVAEREVAAVEKGIRAIQRFLPDVSAEQRREVETKLSELNEILVALKAELKKQSL